MTEQRVRIEISERIATVTLTRPDKHNALDQAMFAAIIAAAEQVASTPGVRAVVLHGAGPSFCPGIDLAGLMSGADGIDAIHEELRGDGPNRLQRVA